MFQDSEKLLRYTLIGNGIFSSISGIVLIIFSASFTELFGVPYEYYQIGISLVLFAGFVLYAAFRKVINKKQVQLIIAMDVLWVLGSIILLISPVNLTSAGVWSVIIIAIFVADFALFQYKGLEKVLAARFN